MRCSTDHSGGGRLHVRLAETDDERASLARTAAVLDLVRHPGIVEVVEAATGRLATWWIGSDLRTGADGWDLAEVAGFGASAATTLGDLHSLGWAHNAVEPAHLLLGSDGAPVWCGFGQATQGAAGREGDVAALARMLRSMLPPCGERRSLRTVTAALADAERGKLDAAGLARRLADRALAPRLPLVRTADADADDAAAADAEDGVGPHDRVPDGAGLRALATRAGALRVPVLLGVAAVSIAAFAVAAGVVGGSGGSGGSGGDSGAFGVTGGGSHSASASVTACPAVDEGCSALAIEDGVLTTPSGRYALSLGGAHGGGPPPVVVLGRWDCGPVALPAILQPASGSVWVWDRWALAGADVAARPFAAFPGASTLRVVALADGCDRLAVVRRDGSTLVVDVGGAQ